jgi:hypothetical protein
VRICLVSAEYPPMQGGVGDCTHELGRALVQLGHQVAVVTSVPKIPNARSGLEPAVYPACLWVSAW